MNTQKINTLILVIIAIILVGLLSYFLFNNKNIKPLEVEKTTFDQSSEYYANIAKDTWNGFFCSALATKMNDDTESQRLFAFAYNQGSEFIGAYKAGKITKEDMSFGVPVWISSNLKGPNNEFILGRIYGVAQTTAFEDLSRGSIGDKYSKELENNLAVNDFSNRGCKTLGN